MKTFTQRSTPQEPDAAAAAATVLVVEDGSGEREALARVLRMESYSVLTARNAEEALRLIDEPIDVVVSDLKMGKASGLDLLRVWGPRRPDSAFIMVTAYGDVESAVTAMKLGAIDYLTKPVDPETLLRVVKQSVESRRAQWSSRAASPPPGEHGLEDMLGRSPVMREVFDQIRRAARTESTVLIHGESGTGKELAAAAIHRHSSRREGPYVVVNMAAIPDTLVESELFGHVRGAFTGATTDRIGRFEAAERGTIFIDEIGDFPLPSQAKLLRVLENRTLSPVGGSHDRAINVRVVAATSRDLHRLTASGAFREDLYYRLHVLTIHLPPLRERREDVPLLAEHFRREVSQAVGKPDMHLADDLLTRLQDFDWPGNVRQLRNTIESMIVMARGDVLTPADLPEGLLDSRPTASQSVQVPPEADLEGLERAAILQALDRFGGNRTHAAEALGISVRTLQRRLKEWSLG